jgi:peptide/nickel transport system permease protein
MFAFILRRLFQAMIVMTTVAFIAFLLFQYVGDPGRIPFGAGRHA